MSLENRVTMLFCLLFFGGFGLLIAARSVGPSDLAATMALPGVLAVIVATVMGIGILILGCSRAGTGRTFDPFK